MKIKFNFWLVRFFHSLFLFKYLSHTHIHSLRDDTRMSHVCMSLGTHINESWHTYEGVLAHMHESAYVPHMHGSHQKKLKVFIKE